MLTCYQLRCQMGTGCPKAPIPIYRWVSSLHDMFTYKTHISFKSDIWEGQFINVKLCNENKYICIAKIYRPPKDINSSTIIETFIEELDPIITDLNKSNSKIVLLGDYNIN